ncbi:MAG: 1,4-alpha-glucan branching protein GlgB [Candidatus Accumulibacter sp.]|jgi:1,4-alpha-glucan branching enzyme|nr:1,4-alpha-glucan branching protein GlgB [Accumulibacter sp.]
MLDEADIVALSRGEHGDPFAVLGVHADGEGRFLLRSFQPGAKAVFAINPRTGSVLAALSQRKTREGDSGLFEGALPERWAPGKQGKPRAKNHAHLPRGLADVPPAYRLRIVWPGGVQETDDPYRFPPLLGEVDVWLLAEGSHLRPFEQLGAHVREIDGVKGTAFAVWAPDARRVSVVGDFNAWDGLRHPMRLRRECGVWEIFLPDLVSGARYKYEIRARDGRLLPQKADPYAFAAEVRPATASLVHELPPKLPPPQGQSAVESLCSPVSIYEVHLGSWRRTPSGEFLGWEALSETLIPYVADLGFTHIELLPVAEYPFDDSWGYQPVGLYAPTSRFGAPEGFRNFVSACHAAGVKVIVDWVPGHFPSDAHGLARFDGSALYECADPREGTHPDWGTLIYNFGRREVLNYLVGSALFWIERYGVDGLRVDAVASMLYRDYSRKEGEWIPNVHGGRENIEAIGFLRRVNEVIGRECPWAVTFAEESTAWPSVSRPPSTGGLGFHYKWNMGWMHDVLDYMACDPVFRRYHHKRLSFGLLYAFSENFVLPLSHDEVVHGKRSLIGRMPGDTWQKFANLRALYAFMWAHPGKKLLFMGGEFAQWNEWNFAGALDWSLLEFPLHDGVKRLVRDLNGLYRVAAALHEVDFDPAGFEWISADDIDNSAIVFARFSRDRSNALVCVCNFTPLVRHAYRIGVPGPGTYRERINTDSRYYGGSDVGTPFGATHAERIAFHGREYSIEITLPPLAVILFEWEH